MNIEIHITVNNGALEARVVAAQVNTMTDRRNNPGLDAIVVSRQKLPPNQPIPQDVPVMVRRKRKQGNVDRDKVKWRWLGPDSKPFKVTVVQDDRMYKLVGVPTNPFGWNQDSENAAQQGNGPYEAEGTVLDDDDIFAQKFYKYTLTDPSGAYNDFDPDIICDDDR